MIEKIKRNKEKIFLYGALIAYAIVSLIGAITHESWSDEAQAWLIARDLGVFDIVKQMRYEGHSCLWHLVLFPFAHLGFPFETLKIISWFFCVVAVYLILKKAPFHKITKLLLIFNPAMIYLYPAVSRCYAMIPVVVSCIAIVYKDREKHPYLYATLLALLANTHVTMFPMAGMLFLFFWGEKLFLKRKEITQEEKKVLWKSCGIVIIGFLFLIIQVLPGVFECKVFHVGQTVSQIKEIKQIIPKFQQAIQDMTNRLFQDTLMNTILFYIAIELFVVTSVYDKKQGLVFWLQIIFSIVINGFLFFMIDQRVFLIIVYTMFFVWVYEPKFKKEESLLVKKLPEIAFLLILIVTLTKGYSVFLSDITKSHSASKQVAEYIEANLPEGSTFICPNNERVSPVIAYFKRGKYQFYSPNARRYYSYVSWDKDWYNNKTTKAIQEAVEKLKTEGKDNIYCLIPMYEDYSYVAFLEFGDNYERILIANDVDYQYCASNEMYVLYKVHL